MATHEMPNLGLTGGFVAGEDDWGEAMNANLLKLSTLTQGGVIGRVAALPTDPAPAEGDVYILTTDNTIAVYDEAAWSYFAPREGWLIFDRETQEYLTFDGTAWAVLETGGGGGGIEDAPADGTLYGRKDNAWAVVPAGGGSGGGSGGTYRGDWGSPPSVLKTYTFDSGLVPDDFDVSVPASVVISTAAADPAKGHDNGLIMYFAASADRDITIPINPTAEHKTATVRSWVSSEVFDFFRVLQGASQIYNYAGIQGGYVDNVLNLSPSGAKVLTLRTRADGGGTQGRNNVWISEVTVPVADPEFAYLPGDTVKHAGAYWLCLVSGATDTPSTDSTQWVKIGPDSAVAGGTIVSTENRRMWRIRASDSQSGTYVSVAEVEFRDAIGGADLATGGTAMGSIAGGLGHAQAFDNNTAGDSRWAAETQTPWTEKWVGYRFPGPVTVKEVAIWAPASLGVEAPKDFAIEFYDATRARWIAAVVVYDSPNWGNGEVRTYAVPASVTI